MEAFEYPIDGTLDLHTFRPNEVKDLVPDYLEACLDKGIHEVRIIHGKGQGVLRRLVHSLLEKDPHVSSFRTPTDTSSWGATIVNLKHDA